MNVTYAIQAVRAADTIDGILSAMQPDAQGEARRAHFEYIATGGSGDLKAIDRKLEIPDFRVDDFERALAGINRRAERLGLDPLVATHKGVKRHTVSVGGGSRSTKELKDVTTVTDHTRQTYTFNLVTFHVTGQPPILPGWLFRASIDLGTHSRPMIRALVPKVPERFYQTDMHCEHCNLSRQRNDVFLLESRETGRWMQVGKTCLRDFTGVNDAEKIMLLFRDALKFIGDWDDAYDPDDPGGSMGLTTGNSDDLAPFLTIVAALVERQGFVSKARADDTQMSTADAAMMALHDLKMPGAKTPQWIKDAWRDAGIKANVEAAIEWAKTQPPDNNFLRAIQLIAEDGHFHRRREAGMAAAIYGTWKREHDKAAEREATINEHLPGQVGDRHKGYRLYTLSVRALETDFGTSHLHIFRDDDGRQFKWFGSREIDQREGFDADFTVKAHDEYRGVKQTVITRVKDAGAERAKKRADLVEEIALAVQRSGQDGEAFEPIPEGEKERLGLYLDVLVLSRQSGRSRLLNLTSLERPDYRMSLAPAAKDDAWKAVKKLEKLE